MAGQYRDHTIPYSQSELEVLKKGWQALKSYKDGYVSTSDFPKNGKINLYLKYSDVQWKTLMDFCDNELEGVMHEDFYVELMRGLHKTSLYAIPYIKHFDKMKDGFISSDEFGRLLSFLVVHDSTLAVKTFQDFLQEADRNLDGKVSIVECANWIEKNCGDKWRG